jgi:peptide/nickel transport system permease protein
VRRFVIRRLGAGVLQVILVSFIAWFLFFFVARISGANPAARVAGKDASQQTIARVAHEIGTDRPYYEQYARYLWHLLQGDLGYSYLQGRSVSSIVFPAAATTLSLVCVALAIWLLLSIPIGLFTALRAGSRSDLLIRAVVILGMSTPVFVLAPLMSYLFAFQPAEGMFLGIGLPGPTNVFPLDGYVNLKDNPIEWLHHLLLPGFVMAAAYAAMYVRYVRALTLEQLNQDYVRTAVAKGAGPGRVLRRHVSRNIAPIIVTLIGLDFGSALGGVLFVETVFALPGLGYVALRAILDLDYAVASGVITFTAVAAVAVNALIDVAQGAIDPRTRA